MWLDDEQPVDARSAINRAEHLYPGRLQWASDNWCFSFFLLYAC